MGILWRLRRSLAAIIYRLPGLVVLSACSFYVLASYLALSYAGERELTEGRFLYWLVVTASTVGYGDLSPVTEMGGYIVAFWVIPCGIALFTVALGRLGIMMIEHLKKKHRGKLTVNRANHVIIVGYNGERTKRIIAMLSKGDPSLSGNVVLCAKGVAENPFPSQVEFVSVTSYSNQTDMAKCRFPAASAVIIDIEDDAETLTAALLINTLNPSCHKTAYVISDEIKQLMRSHCPNIEITPSVSVEMLANAALHPGSSELHKQLLDTTFGQTQYSCKLESGSATFGELFLSLKQKHGAILIAVSNLDGMLVNPDNDHMVLNGERLYYIADKQIGKV